MIKIWVKMDRLRIIYSEVIRMIRLGLRLLLVRYLFRNSWIMRVLKSIGCLFRRRIKVFRLELIVLML